MMGFGFVGFMLVGGAIIVAVLAGLGLLSGKGMGMPWQGARQPAARQILNERFARGEISAEAYEAIREQLER